MLNHLVVFLQKIYIRHQVRDLFYKPLFFTDGLFTDGRIDLIFGVGQSVVALLYFELILICFFEVAD
jgi:hypothetical protein